MGTYSGGRLRFRLPANRRLPKGLRSIMVDEVTARHRHSNVGHFNGNSQLEPPILRGRPRAFRSVMN